MSKYTDFIKNKGNREDAIMDRSTMINGSFLCQDPLCDEEVDEADYFVVDSLLIWKCNNNHSSFIEGFRLS